jgi:hypothetical protein
LSRFFTFSWGCATACALVAAPIPAYAEPKDAEARALAKEAMDEDFLGTRFQEARDKLQKALKGCGKQGCSASVRGALHVDLAVVLFADKKQDKGKQELRAAVEADPQVELPADYATPELEAAFASAGGVAGEKKPAPETEEPEAEAPARDTAPTAAESGPAEGPSGASLHNWLSVAFQQDLLFYGQTSGVCSGADQYQCFLQGQSYGGPIYPGSGNQLKGGVGFATKRVLVGYERVLGENLSLGAKLGFAFGGSPKATTGKGTAFLPIHAELRGSYWFGSAPFASSGLRPYVGLAAGLGEVDGHVAVEYFQDDAGYLAGAKGKLDAWRKTGNGFVGLHLGAAFAFAQNQQLFVELRLLQMLGASATGGAVSLGYAFGM